MRIGLQVPSFTWPGGAGQIEPTLKHIAQIADEAGFYSLWVMDHFFQIEVIGPPENDMLEGYSTLTYLAAVTETVKLGTLVTGVIYRYPGILIKTVTTLDVLSGGRAYLGIGAAWFEREAHGLGVPYPSLKVRFEQLEETLQIAQQMWSAENGPYAGQHYQLAETLCVPQPVSQPHPPIMIGGLGEKKTLRMVAQYADATNLFTWGGVDMVKHKLSVMRQHCDNLGRDYAEIEKTGLASVHLAADAMSAQDVIKLCQDLAGVGIEHLIFNMPNVHDITPLETFAQEIIPAVADF